MKGNFSRRGAEAQRGNGEAGNLRSPSPRLPVSLSCLASASPRLCVILFCTLLASCESNDERNVRLREEALEEGPRPDPSRSGNMSGPGNY